MRMRAGDLLAASFPAATACPENLPPGDLAIPTDHPLVRQTLEDCLTEATDVEGLIDVLRGLRDGSIERTAVDTPEPSAFARGILNSEMYTFLDDAPLEERRTQAVLSRRSLDRNLADTVGALDPAAVERVRGEAWPQPESGEDVHDALLWMGFATDSEVATWRPWIDELARQNRVIHGGDRWFAVDGPAEPKKVLLGRLEALGPVFEDDARITLRGDEHRALLLELEHDGAILRTRFEGREAWCERRLLARIHRYTVDALRREIEPVTPAQFTQFLACWQHADPAYMLEGPRGVAEVLGQLAGFEAPAIAWERDILPRRVRDYRKEWLDEVTLGGEFAWGRLWGGAGSAIRVTPVAFVPREHLDEWIALTNPANADGLGGPARDLLNAFARSGPMFPQNLPKAAQLVPAHVEMGLAELLAHGLITCDSFGALRQMITPPSKRRAALRPVGRWAAFRTLEENHTHGRGDELTELVARQLLRRTGVVFRKSIERERIPLRWSALSRVYRRMELRGEIRGGRFVSGFSGEQFALPEAVQVLRNLRKRGPRHPVTVAPSDPLFLEGILLPGPDPLPRVRPSTRAIIVA
jgi:ATP-dependent Lhr-like helicase